MKPEVVSIEAMATSRDLMALTGRKSCAARNLSETSIVLPQARYTVQRVNESDSIVIFSEDNRGPPLVYCVSRSFLECHRNETEN